ncbi:MAG: hypothetical protein K2X38_11465 [Gemmataceae bacterium]|nr:hypothetical protein [Gemmataceae bacterium]
MGRYFARWTAAALLWACLLGHAAAQARIESSPIVSPDTVATVNTFLSTDSQVSFIDSALPRNMLRTRFDVERQNRRPLRDGYLFARSSLPKPESNVDVMNWNTMLEIAPSPWISVFVEQPMRWLNPDVNANASGIGDLAFGFKYAIIDTQPIVASFQLRATMPTGEQGRIGVRQWTIQPGLLLNYRPVDFLLIEGEAHYWAGLGGGPYTGDLFRYGIGLAYGQRPANEIWFNPVIEAQGWTILSGGSEVVHPSGAVEYVNAAGQTILNASAGVRVGFGRNIDLFGGYSRALTGSAWSRDLFRVEMRLLY